ncbi:hypothetical protein GI584_13160 [Gracilibacillus salitolerans]|uniref:Uncharacterized protein n=1 Tax=Gracilibacillus salitolerans TaxID=2663022 RepID=A0A5Q2TLA0_9BACI|nr:hypothetical protein [Gracilibacillus salitolerans]QGH34931.1 hypothetical protein GI584_13160 [Gracilibacillus salitolerans]
MKVTKVFFFLTALVSIVFVFRNSITRVITTVPVLRKWGVRIAMSIPFIRHKMIGSMFK